MVKGQTYSEQLFESEAFRHFINTFLAGKSGITKGCEITQGTTSIDISEGYFVIMGGMLKEEGTSNTLPTEAGYYRLVYEIDLSKTNTEAEFNQGNYKFIKGTGSYAGLTQEDLENDGNVYQFEFCQFRITESGIQDFVDKRTFLNFKSIYEEIRKKIEAIEDGSAYALKKDVEGTILYEDEIGTTGDITLKDSVDNYNYIEIYYKTSIRSSSIKIQDFNDKNISLSIVAVAATTYAALTKEITISEMSINKVSEYEHVRHITVGDTFSETDTIYIYKVIGYKY